MALVAGNQPPRVIGAVAAVAFLFGVSVRAAELLGSETAPGFVRLRSALLRSTAPRHARRQVSVNGDMSASRTVLTDAPTVDGDAAHDAVDSLRELAAELQASRTRLVEASDEARRRLERDLHDGAQQRLVSASLALAAATRAADRGVTWSSSRRS